MLALLIKLLGGRPMRYEGNAFVDCVSGKSVNYYIDRLGRKWMAENKWSSFRIERKHHD